MVRFQLNTIFHRASSQRYLRQGLSTIAVLSLLFTVDTHAETKLGYRMSQPAPMMNHPQPNVYQNQSGSTFANSTYKDVTVPPHMTRPPLHAQPYPAYPGHAYPNQPYPPYPQGNHGVTIIYNQSLPSQTTYSTQSYGYVNGNGSIESSSYMLISDWRRYGLPDPAVGMHWIYQNGRYLQVPNDQ